MPDIPKESIDAMKTTILGSIERFGFVEVTGLVRQTLRNEWLFAHNLLVARRDTDQPPYNNEYVIYRSQRKHVS